MDVPSVEYVKDDIIFDRSGCHRSHGWREVTKRPSFFFGRLGRNFILAFSTFVVNSYFLSLIKQFEVILLTFRSPRFPRPFVAGNTS